MNYTPKKPFYLPDNFFSQLRREILCREEITGYKRRHVMLYFFQASLTSVIPFMHIWSRILSIIGNTLLVQQKLQTHIPTWRLAPWRNQWRFQNEFFRMCGGTFFVDNYFFQSDALIFSFTGW